MDYTSLILQGLKNEYNEKYSGSIPSPRRLTISNNEMEKLNKCQVIVNYHFIIGRNNNNIRVSLYEPNFYKSKCVHIHSHEIRINMLTYNDKLRIKETVNK